MDANYNDKDQPQMKSGWAGPDNASHIIWGFGIFYWFICGSGPLQCMAVMSLNLLSKSWSFLQYI